MINNISDNKGVDVVFHLAALGGLKKNEENKIYSKKLNYNSNKFIIDSVKKKTHIIFLSSDKVYNGKIKKPNEKSNTSPHGIYAKFKRQSELLFIKNIQFIEMS